MSKNLIYQVYCGPNNPLYNVCIDSAKRYCNIHGIDHIVQKDPILKILPQKNPSLDLNILQKRDHNSNPKRLIDVLQLGYWSEFEKFNAFDYRHKGYDNICMLDADIYIKDNSPNIFNEIGNYNVAAHYTMNKPLPSKEHVVFIQKYYEQNYGFLRNFVNLPYVRIHGIDVINIITNSLMIVQSNFLNRVFGDCGVSEWLKKEENRIFIDRIDSIEYSGIGDTVLSNFWIWKNGICAKQIDWRFNLYYRHTLHEIRQVHEAMLERAFFVHFVRDTNYKRDLFLNKQDGNIDWIKKIRDTVGCLDKKNFY